LPACIHKRTADSVAHHSSRDRSEFGQHTPSTYRYSRMTGPAAAHIHKDKCFAQMLHTFTGACHKDGFHPPAPVVEELFRKIGRPDASLMNTKLCFKDFNIEDQLLSYMLDALAVYPVVEAIDLSENYISDVGAKYLLKLLRAQANLVKNVHIDKRLYATFISSVDLSDNGDTISPHVSDEIVMMCETLSYANVQTIVRKAFLSGGCRHHVSDAAMTGVWNNIIKDQFPALEGQVEEAEILKRHYASGTHEHNHLLHTASRRPQSPGRSIGGHSQYSQHSQHSQTSQFSQSSSWTAGSSRLPTSIAEVAVMRALQAAERVPYLTRWQYSLLAVPELRSDESFSDKSVLYASTVFDHMEDSLSVSNSHIAFSPDAKAKKSQTPPRAAADSMGDSPRGSSSGAESDAEHLYRVIDTQDRGFFTAPDLQAALESSQAVVEAFMFYMSNTGSGGGEGDDMSTLDSASLFSMPDESKHLVRLMDAKNSGKVMKLDFLSFITKSANALSMKDLSSSPGFKHASPPTSGLIHALVTDSDSGRCVRTCTVLKNMKIDAVPLACEKEKDRRKVLFEMISDSSFDMILIDLGEAADWVLFKELRESSASESIPVIALFSNDEKTMEDRAIDMGAKMYIMHPVDINVNR
jgi:CheY-like chemotaxis protein